MKKVLLVVLSLCLVWMMIAGAAAEQVDLSKLSDTEFLELYARMQQELITRHIEKTAKLQIGTYVGGKDIPTGRYILTAAGTEKQYGIVSLRAAADDPDDWPSKLYKFNDGDDDYSVFVTIEEGDTLVIPFPYTLTVYPGVLFQ